METVWNDGQGGASGGGISTHFAVPAYQQALSIPNSIATGNPGRGVPDIAGDADPATGYNVRIDGTDTVIGGTSAVAPLWAALVAIVNQLTGTRAGLLNPILYGNAGALTDITEGDNQVNGEGYGAGPGWDACTGLGTPIGTAVLNAVRAAAASPAPPPAA
jgi:kumamolisin